MPQFPITITGVDRVTAVIDRVNKRLETINAPAERLQKAFSKLGEVSGMTKLSTAFSRVASYALDVFRNVTRIVAPLAALTGAGSIAGMYKLVSGWSELGQRLSFTARRMGMGVGQLNDFEGAARLAGASAESLDSGLETLGMTVTDAIGGRNPQALMYLNEMGIRFRDVNNQARPVAELMPEIADRIASLKNPYLQMRLATEMFGGSAKELMPFLLGGSKGIKELTDAVKKYDPVTEEMTKRAVAFQKSQTFLALAVEGLVHQVGDRLIPIIQPLLEKMTAWIARNREWLASEISQRVKELSDRLQAIPWNSIVDNMKEFGTYANAAAGYVGGWKTAVEILFGLWLGSKFVAVLANISILGARIYSVLTALGLINPAVAAALAPLALKGDTPGADVPGGTGSPEMLRQNYLEEEQWHRTHGRGPYSGLLPRGSSGSWGSPATGSWNSGGSSISRAMAYFQSVGWSRAQAAGLAANMQTESGMRTGAVGDTGQAYGLGQWHPDRQANFARWAGHDIRRSTEAEQLAFANYELTQGGERAAGRRLRGATTASEAGADVSRFYERPADVFGEMGKRGALANRIDMSAPMGTAGQPGPNGHATIVVRVPTAPSGTAVHATTSGELFRGAPKIERSFADFDAA
jgi:hypothetical protein